MTGWKSVMDAIVQPAVARSRTIDEIAVDSGVLADLGAVCRRHFEPQSVLLFADENTWAAAGKVAAGHLEAAGLAVEQHIVPAAPRPKPTLTLGEEFAGRLAKGDATPVAVGSGVVNDLVKYAAFTTGRPYLSVATAASMDGYSSAGAPMLDQGFKKTLPCRGPRAIVADLDVIGSAPPEMSGWGYGDLASKMPAGGDWIIADGLGIEPLDDIAWPLVQDNLRGWLAEPGAVRSGEAPAVAGLFAGLTIAGLAMEFHGTSRPASGADHQIAHLWEMQGLSFRGEVVAHGACVSLASLATLALFDWVLARNLTRLNIETLVANAASLADKEKEIDDLSGPGEIADRAKEETAAKHLEPDAHRARLALIRKSWPGLHQRLSAHLMHSGTMRGLLQQAGAPVTASDIGMDVARLRATILAGKFLRSRYTILDLLDEIGLLRRAVEEAIGPEFEVNELRATQPH